MALKLDLEDRLIQFAALIIEVAEALPSTMAGKHLASQLIRSGTSPCLNYGEAQGAESKNDFIHKMKIGLKELRETYCCLKIIQIKKWLSDEKIPLNETSQLIAIFYSSIATAKKNISTSKQK